jgi:hypothetical protein
MRDLDACPAHQPPQPQAPQKRDREAVENNLFREQTSNRRTVSSGNVNLMSKSSLPVGEVSTVSFRSSHSGGEQDMQDFQLMRRYGIGSLIGTRVQLTHEIISSTQDTPQIDVRPS